MHRELLSDCFGIKTSGRGEKSRVRLTETSTYSPYVELGNRDVPYNSPQVVEGPDLHASTPISPWRVDASGRRSASSPSMRQSPMRAGPWGPYSASTPEGRSGSISQSTALFLRHRTLVSQIGNNFLSHTPAGIIPLFLKMKRMRFLWKSKQSEEIGPAASLHSRCRIQTPLCLVLGLSCQLPKTGQLLCPGKSLSTFQLKKCFKH